MYIEEARRQLTDITKFHPTNANTSHRFTYETKGWPKTTDPHAVIEVFHAWGWSALVISKKDGGQRSTFNVGSQVPPPCGILYLAEGAIILNEILKQFIVMHSNNIVTKKENRNKSVLRRIPILLNS